MPIYDLECVECHLRTSALMTVAAAFTRKRFCPSCGGQLDIVPSVPAPVRVGKYGKGGGLPPETNND